MKASQIIQGTRATRLVPLPTVNGRTLQTSTATPDGDAAVAPFCVRVRALTGLEYLRALEETARAAKRLGGEAKPGDPIYDMQLAAQMVALGVMDPDAPEEPFFDGGAEQILGSIDLGRDGIAYLAEQVEVECAAQRTITQDDLNEAIVKLCGPDGGDYFFQCAPGFRVSLARSMAGLLLTLLTDRSESGSVSEGATTN